MVTLTIGVTDQSSKIIAGSLSVKLNTLDVRLKNPSPAPVEGDTVTLVVPDNPVWTGVVKKVGTKDPVERIVGFSVVTISATNEVEGLAAPAPFFLSDVADSSYDLGLENGSGDILLEDGSGAIALESLSYKYSRLSVEKIRNDDGSLETHGTVRVKQPGLWPAQTFKLSSTNQGIAEQDYTVRNVTITLPHKSTPLFDVEFGDPIVTMSVWLNSNPGPVLPITSTKITDNAVTTPKLAAGSVTADKLEAILILATMIRAGAAPQHMEMDADGLRAYNSAGDLIVNIPNDGSDATFNAQVIAKTLSVVGNAFFSGALSEVAMNAVLQLDAFMSDPGTPPALAQGLDTIDMPHDNTYDLSGTAMNRWGLEFDPAGGADGATPVFWTTAWNGSKLWLLELKASDRTVNRAADLLYSQNSALGVARIGSDVYAGMVDIATATVVVKKFPVSTLAGPPVTFVPVDVSGLGTLYSFVFGGDGTSPYLANKPSGTGTIKWNRYNASMVKQGATIDTGYNSGSNDTLGDIRGGNFDFGAARILVLLGGGKTTVESFTTAGARQSSEQFSTIGSGGSGLAYGDALGDGARMWTMRNSVDLLTKHTTWTWPAATSSVVWVGYSWHDSVGTMHDTKISPRASTTMGRRKKLTITAQAPPGGIGEIADEVRFFLNQAAADPGAGKHVGVAEQVSPTFVAYLPATPMSLSLEDLSGHILLEDGSVLLTDSGFADSTVNDFPTGSPAELKSQVTGWSLKGDGTFQIANKMHASFSGAQSLTSGTWATINHNTVDVDPLSTFNTTTHVWTCPVTGWYLISHDAAVSTGSARIGSRVNKNSGSTFGQTVVPQPTSGHATRTFFLFLTAGDTLTHEVFEDAATGSLTVVAELHILYIGAT